MNYRNLSALALATAASALFASVPATVQAADEATVHCAGINSCKGTSACKTADNACKGQNACKGIGFTVVSQAECDAKGGKVI
jgi:hypothetical protein